jgi:hypothetical protein
MPDNGSYMVAAYVVTAVVLVVYSVGLFLRTKSEKKNGE